jgi:hypothetical protein
VQSCAYKLVVCTVPNCGYNCIRRAALRLHCIRGAKHICEICMRSAAAFGKQIFLLIFVCAVLCCGYNKLFSAVPRIQFTFYISTVDTNGVPGLSVKFKVPCSAYKISYPLSMADTACIHSANIKSKLYPRHSTEKFIVSAAQHCAYKFVCAVPPLTQNENLVFTSMSNTFKNS